MSNSAEQSPELQGRNPESSQEGDKGAPAGQVLRPHVYDGIQEYDKRLPNWWLTTLWRGIIFSFFYWFVRYQIMDAPRPGYRVEAEMKANQAIAARNSGTLSNDVLWEMSHETKVVEAGRATFATTCVSCHLPDLTGQIGPNLKDEYWIHGGQPMEIFGTIEKGVLEKGMPTWGPILGKQKIAELAAFILSFHKMGEPIQKAAGWAPGQGNIFAPATVSAASPNPATAAH